MCGRTACACEPQAVARACTYRSKRSGSRVQQPRWVNGRKKGDVGSASGRARYYPSFNVGPHTNMPILLSADHPHCTVSTASASASAAATSSSQPEKSGSSVSSGGRGERVLQAMRWGLVPVWHKGDPKRFGTMLNNCRFENINEKPSFRNALKKGQRCVIVCEGFYEWKTTGKIKQPYFMHFTSDSTDLTDEELAAAQEEAEVLDAVEASDREEQLSEDFASSGSHGGDRAKFADRQPKRLLTMAGLFDIWHPPHGSEFEAAGPLYTYSIITVEASSEIAWLHHRMPAILDGEEAIANWLDFSHVPNEKALELIRPTTCLKWHPVTQAMGNCKYKNTDAIAPIDLDAKKPIKATGLTSWLKVSPVKRKAEEQEQDGDKPEAKKEKAADE